MCGNCGGEGWYFLVIIMSHNDFCHSWNRLVMIPCKQHFQKNTFIKYWAAQNFRFHVPEQQGLLRQKWIRMQGKDQKRER